MTSEIQYDAVFFDFDGVILDSVEVKTQAFAKMFRHYGQEIEREVIKYHLSNGGLSRFEKFRYYYEHLLNKPVSTAELERLGDQFSDFALQGVLACSYLPGALETLRQLKKAGIPSFIVTGTPDKEIQLILKLKNLESLFLEAQGSPKTKYAITQELMKRYSLSPKRCLFVGDAMTDFETAQQCGTDFLGICLNLKLSPFPSGTLVKTHVQI